MAEQVAPWCADALDEARAMPVAAASAHGVDKPCLLLACFGENTRWQWAAEMLVKAAVAERFILGISLRGAVLDHRTLCGAKLCRFGAESLAAYGISQDGIAVSAFDLVSR